jgi:drug/metabolite transporter (DMT)-like permease
MSNAMTPRLWGLLVTLSVLWGGSFFFMAVSLTALPPFTIVLVRMTLGFLALLAICRVMGQSLPATREAWIACAGMGMLNSAIPFTLIVVAQQHIPSGLASVVNAATPVFAVLVAHVLTVDEKLTANRLAGTLTGLAGVALLAGPAAFGAGAELLGILLGLSACLSYGLSGVWSRRLRRLGLAPLSMAAAQCLTAGLALLPLVLAFDRPWTLPMPNAAALGAVIALGLVSTGIAYLLFFTVIARAGATNAMLVTLMVPVTALLLGTAVLGEQLLPRHFLGMAVIFAGLLLIDGRVLKRLRAR